MQVWNCRPTEIRTQVLETIREHWVRPQFSNDHYRVPLEQVDKVARDVLDTMLTRQFRVGPLPTAEIYDKLLERVRWRVRRGQPIHVTQGYAPLKNLNVVRESRADWAEFFALFHLAAWHNKVQRIYPPGLRIQIAFDDTPLFRANHSDRKSIDSYISSIRQLIPALGLEQLIVGTVRHSVFSWLFHLGFYQLAERRVRRWEENPAHRPQLERMEAFARRNVVVPTGLTGEKQDTYLRQASHQYRVYWEALQLSGLSNGKPRIVSMYLDGSQHHIRQAVALHLTSVAKGQVTQPWQGSGVLLDNGHGQLVPFVLTGGRSENYQTQVVRDLDFVPLPGFDHILVATPYENLSERRIESLGPEDDFYMVPDGRIY